MSANWTKKEQNLLKELQNAEKLCVEKYRKAARQAADPALGEIFSGIEQAEQKHFSVLGKMVDGTVPTLPAQNKAKSKASKEEAPAPKNRLRRTARQEDAYLLADLLGTEKYVSAVYNTAIFEFTDEKARQTLGSIQQQEQFHGKQIADYMQANHMEC